MEKKLRVYIFFISCLVFAFPFMGRADENFDLNSGKVTITEAGTYKFENYEGANKVIVNASDKEVDITISGLKIDVSKFPNCAFEIQAGTVNLTLEGTNVLKSGNLKAGLQVPEGSTLTIKGDGVLDVTGGSQGAGIGGGRSGAGGTIKILGGTVNANGGSSGAGIGGGSSGAGGSIIIIEGIVNATGGNSGAGIGGGSNGAVGTIKIQGGTVNANGGSSGAGIGGSGKTGGDITITEGTVNATGGSGGAGIGGGSSSAGGTITITGGTVTATGGNNGAGIGGGTSGAGGTIIIQGGNVKAIGKTSGAGIGGGSNGNGGTIAIETGIVNATGGDGGGAGIGGGGSRGAGGIITITGGTVTAEGGNMGAQIGGGSNGDGGEITITGGVVNAPIAGLGAGIGKGYDGKNNGTFSAKNGNAFINVSSISDQSDKENWKGIIFDGYNGQVYGKQKLETNAEIPKGKTLTIKDDQKLTLGKGVTLTNNGTINGIENIIYTVTYHNNDGDEESEDVEVAHNSIPSYSNFTRQYYSIDGWHDKASDGQKVENITGSIDLYANWKENEIKTKLSISDIKGTYGKEIKYNLSNLLSTDSYKDNIIYTSSDLEEYGLSILNKQITGTPKKAIDDNSTVTITISSVDCMKEVEAKVPINIAKGKSSIDEFVVIPNSTYSGKAIDITAPFVKDESGNKIKDAIVGLSYQIKTNDGQYESTTADNSGASNDGEAPKYAGEYKVTASFAGNDNYAEAEAKNVVFTIEKVSLTVNPLPGQIIFPNETETYKPKYEVTGAVNNETLEFSGDLKLDDGKKIVDNNLTLNNPFDKNYSMTVTENVTVSILDNVAANEKIILSGTIEDGAYIDQVTVMAPSGFLIKSEGGALTKAENDYKESFIWSQTGTFDISYKLQRIEDGQESDPYIVRVTVKNKSEEPDKPVNPPVEPEEPTVYYTVTLPSVDGVTTDPVAGDYKVEAWDSFRFYLTIGKDYNLSKPVVTTSRHETIEPRSSDGAYIIKYVRTDVEIRIDGVVKNPDPVANTEIQSGIKVWGNNHRLFIRTDRPEEVSVYTFSGQLQKKFRSEAGDRLLSLPSGTYIVLIGDERFKVIL